MGEALFRAAGRVPRFPPRGLGDLVHDLRILGVSGLLAASTAALTVRDVLRLLGLGRDVAFRALIAMLLQDTAQAGPETVPFAQAAACLQAYRRGMSRPGGGMRALVEGIGGRFAALGGDLRTATLVDRVTPTADGHFAVETRRRHRLIARQVAFNLPLDLAAALLGRDLDGLLRRRERRSRAVWSAFTGYLAIDRRAVPDDSPLFHQVLQDYDRPFHDGNNVLVSLSPPDDPGYGPPDARVVTMSTHTPPGDWDGLDPVGLFRPEGRLPGPAPRGPGPRPARRPGPRPPRRVRQPSELRPLHEAEQGGGRRSPGLAVEQRPARRRLRRPRARPLGGRRLRLPRPGDHGHRPLGHPGRGADHRRVVGRDAQQALRHREGPRSSGHPVVPLGVPPR